MTPIHNKQGGTAKCSQDQTEVYEDTKRLPVAKELGRAQ